MMPSDLPDLSDDYVNAAYIPGGPDYPARWAAEAAAFRAAQGARFTRHPYGPGAREWFDLVLPQGQPKGVLIFVHGGYWMAFDPALWSHLAAGVLARGWAVAFPAYDLCPEVRIAAITAQVARVVSAIAAFVPGPVVLSGHSAGGHLVARMLCPDVALSVLSRIVRVVPISPVADLAPLLQTGMNATLQLDAAEVIAESPVHCPPPAVPVTVWVGAAERPVFVAQARLLARVWGAGLVEVPDRHHFDVIAEMVDPESALVAALLGG